MERIKLTHVEMESSDYQINTFVIGNQLPSMKREADTIYGGCSSLWQNPVACPESKKGLSLYRSLNVKI